MSERVADASTDDVPAASDAPVRTRSLSTGDAARALGLSERTIRRAIQRGELAATKTGRGFAISGDALDRYRRERGSRRSRQVRPLLTLVPKSAEPAAPVPFPPERIRSAVLPAPLTRFIGREREAATVAALLRDDAVRLVTLTGPGGVGKTRLAQRVAADLAAAFADGLAFVPLAAVRSADLVPATIALALGVRDGDDKPPQERLLTFLRDRETLLVLDNFEQVVDAGPALVDLLVHCPRLTLLVTSRTPLRVSGERVFAVPPLALPETKAEGRVPSGRRKAEGRDGNSAHSSVGARHAVPGDETVSLEIARSEAVRLFVDRAQAAVADFALTPNNAAEVAAICERADGLPLAIELAAARTALLSPPALLARLERRLPLLSGGPRDQPARLRTMHDAIAWSYDLLSAAEQTLFRRLAVFVGGCTLEAAEGVSGSQGLRVSGRDGGRETEDGRTANTRHPTPDTHPLSPRHPETLTPSSIAPSVIDVVQRLVDQAVLQRQGDGADEPRFTMLETIREFGLERLVAAGEEAAIRDAHAAWCVALAELAEPELAGPEQATWVRRLEADLGNIRAAHDWLIARGDVEAALRLGGAIGWFWSSAPYLEEARVRFDALLAMPGVEQAPAALAKVLWSAGDVADWQGDQPRARAFFERGLAIYRELDDRWRIAGMLRGLGSSAIDRGELDVAVDLLEESLALAREVGNTWEAAAAANLLGVAATARGDLTTALARHEEATAGWRQLGDTGHVVTALTSVAWVALLDNARYRAATAFREALQLAVEGDDAWYIAFSLLGAGATAAAADTRAAAELLAAGGERQAHLGIPLRPHVQAGLDQIAAAVRAHLGEAFAAAREAGRVLSTEAAIERARAVLDAAASAASSADSTPVGSQFGLTLRERDVLRLLVQGRSDKEIAEALFVTRRSASKYVSAVLGKLGVPSRTAAASLALRDNLV